MLRIILKSTAMIAVVVALSVALTSCNNAHAQNEASRAKTEKWEYKITYPSVGGAIVQSADEMNIAGMEGWELVSVTSSNQGTYFFFKRRLP